MREKVKPGCTGEGMGVQSGDQQEYRVTKTTSNNRGSS